MRRTIQGKPGRQAEPDALLPHRGGHGCDDLEREMRPLLGRSSILVRAIIRRLLEKLVDEEPVRAVHLHAVKARALDGVPRRSRVQLHVLSDFGFCQRTRGGWRCLVVVVVDAGGEWDAPSGDVLERRIFSLELFRRCSASECPELQVHV